MFRKAWEKNTDGALDILMKDISAEALGVDAIADEEEATIENIETTEVDNELAQELENES